MVVLMKLLSLTLGAALLVGLTACGSKQEEEHSHPLACAKCECKEMTPDSKDPTKCLSCSHAATDHTKHEH